MTDKEKIGGINNALQQGKAVQEQQNLSNLERNGKNCKEDFEQEWKKYFENRGDVATVNIKDLARHFANWQKEQMMKDAIDEELDDVCGFLTISIPYHNGIAGDKVKVVIIKSE